MKNSIVIVMMLSLFSCKMFHIKDIQPEFSRPSLQLTKNIHCNPFMTLNDVEKQQQWGIEYFIGVKFCLDKDFYRAITAFKRALFLYEEEKNEKTREKEIQYHILLAYYLGGQYQETISVFNKYHLYNLDHTFPAFQDLLIILFESYEKTENFDKANSVLELYKKFSREKYVKLQLARNILHGDTQNTASMAKSIDSKNLGYIESMCGEYEKEKKSQKLAMMFNALIPGAGYFYVEQKKSALSSLLLNSLFIFGAINSYKHKHYAAGTILASLEFGWYVGGIYGGKIAAKKYNECKYEKRFSKILNQENLFPILMLEYGF